MESTVECRHACETPFMFFKTLGLCHKLSQRKKRFLDCVPNNGWVGVKSPKKIVKIYIQLLVLQAFRNVLKYKIHKWGGHIWPHGILTEKLRFFLKMEMLPVA